MSIVPVIDKALCLYYSTFSAYDTMIETRISLKPTLQEFTQHGFPVPPTEENLAQRYQENPEQRDIDLYTLLVPAIGEVVETMTLKNPPLFTSFKSLEDHAKFGIDTSIDSYLRDHSFSETDPIMALATMHQGKESLRGLLKRGATTSTRFMNGTLTQLPYAYKEKYGTVPQDVPTLIRLAEENYSFVVMNAKQHLFDMTTISNFGRSNHAEAFSTALSYAKLDEKDSLYFPEELYEKFPYELRDVEAKPTKGNLRRPIGCPALYSNAVRTLWKWHLVGAESIYRKSLERDAVNEHIVFSNKSQAAD